MNLCMEDTYGTPPDDPYGKCLRLFVMAVMAAAFVAGIMNTLVGQIAR